MLVSTYTEGGEILRTQDTRAKSRRITGPLLCVCVCGTQRMRTTCRARARYVVFYKCERRVTTVPPGKIVIFDGCRYVAAIGRDPISRVKRKKGKRHDRDGKKSFALTADRRKANCEFATSRNSIYKICRAPLSTDVCDGR